MQSVLLDAKSSSVPFKVVERRYFIGKKRAVMPEVTKVKVKQRNITTNNKRFLFSNNVGENVRFLKAIRNTSILVVV